MTSSVGRSAATAEPSMEDKTKKRMKRRIVILLYHSPTQIDRESIQARLDMQENGNQHKPAAETAGAITTTLSQFSGGAACAPSAVFGPSPRAISEAALS